MMLRYILILLPFITGCAKQNADATIKQSILPTCDDNPLFCDDEIFENLPEAEESNSNEEGG